MTKELAKEMYRKFELADQEYDAYVDQFFGGILNEESGQYVPKALSKDDRDIIRALRAKKEEAWKAYKEAFNSWVV